MQRATALGRTPALLFLSLLLLMPAAAAVADQPRLEEIERGFYLQGMAGTKIFLSPPSQGGEAPTVLGMSMGVAAGFDLLDKLQLEAFFSGAQIRAPSTFGGLGGENDPHGDFSSFLLGAKARFAVIGFSDGQGVDRLHLTVNGGGGMIMTRPATVMETGRPAVLGGVGLHYLTRLRHFTVGLEVDLLYGLGANALAACPQARLSYTF